MSRVIRDLQNQQFGHLTALRRVGTSSSGKPVWLCRCSCSGKEIEVARGHLITGHTQSCGCLARKVKDLTAQTFNRLTVIRFVRRAHYIWLCRCLCGKEVEVQGGSLTSGRTKSCGCLQREMASARLIGRRGKGLPGFRHGLASRRHRSPTWQTWESMINRCTNPQATGHEHYFDAGVKICDRWLIFENFLADMGERPEGCTLGRFGDIGNYEKSNCGWQTDREQKAEQKTKRQLAFLAA
jgi:hypothetical protein